MSSEESSTRYSSRQTSSRSRVPAREEEHIRGPQQQAIPSGRTPTVAAPVLEPHQYRAIRAKKLAMAQPQAVAAPRTLDARAQARQARLARIRAMAPDQTVRVNPRDESIRKLLRHPLRSRGFPSTGSVEWPLDTFTRRRLRDGDVIVEKPVETDAAGPSESVD
jgi:hypothetical protein